jgi:uncharacterized membrane protein YfcA
MTTLDIVILGSAAFFTSAMTAVVGSGGGTILIALMLQFMPPVAAIPVHGVVQLASNVWRTWLFRRNLAWHLIWRFALLVPAGIAVGLWLFQGLPAEAVKLLIGCFIIVTLFARRLGRLRDKDLPLWAFFPMGFFVGVLNMIVGVVAPVIGVLIIRKELSKEDYVGTLGFYGVLTNGFKLAGFMLAGFSVVEYGPAILAMVPAVLAGTWAGKRLLGRLSERVFMIVFQTALIALALKLIVWDGAMAWWG